VNKVPEVAFDQAMDLVHSPTPENVKEIYEQTYEIPAVQQEEYWKKGYIKLNGVLSGAALEYIHRLIGAAVLLRIISNQRPAAATEKSLTEQSFLQCGYLCWDFPAVRDFVFARRFAAIARDLMGIDRVRLLHDQALYKEPGGRVTDLHQDISYWPVKTEFTTTFWLALTEVPAPLGNLFFLPGTHKIGLYEYIDIFRKPHMPDRLKNSPQMDVPLQAGDATLHSGLIFHGARANQTCELREAMTITYIEDGARFDATDPRSAGHISCKGLKHGQIVDTRYTPRLI